MLLQAQHDISNAKKGIVGSDVMRIPKQFNA